MDKRDDSFQPVDPVPVPPVPPMPPAPPEPTPVVDTDMRKVLTLGFVAGYFIILVMLHVYWLSFNHPDLQSVALIGDGIFSSATTLILGHYFGAQSTTNAVAPMLRR